MPEEPLMIDNQNVAKVVQNLIKKSVPSSIIQQLKVSIPQMEMIGVESNGKPATVDIR